MTIFFGSLIYFYIILYNYFDAYTLFSLSYLISRKSWVLKFIDVVSL